MVGWRVASPWLFWPRSDLWRSLFMVCSKRCSFPWPRWKQRRQIRFKIILACVASNFLLETPRGTHVAPLIKRNLRKNTNRNHKKSNLWWSIVLWNWHFMADERRFFQLSETACLQFALKRLLLNPADCYFFPFPTTCNYLPTCGRLIVAKL